jgi:hypothetical protein
MAQLLNIRHCAVIPKKKTGFPKVGDLAIMHLTGMPAGVSVCTEVRHLLKLADDRTVVVYRITIRSLKMSRKVS